ncbi:MAG: carotenoid biosynthesis protein [Chloroflexi bacterium]|nr:carotenoid biosynthesis protein [Chloroflexota bacterium]
MKINRISLVFLFFSLVGSLYGTLAVVMNVQIGFPLTPLITLSSFFFAILHASQREGWVKAILLVTIVFMVGLAFESVGVATGLVYGPYHYSDQLGPKFLGLVPYLIPMAWTYMMYPSMVIAERIIPTSLSRLQKIFLIAAVSGVIMTAWDVVMDPMMVSGGFWTWEVRGEYFGVPLQNFFGWWLTTFSAVLLYGFATSKLPVNIPVISDRFAVYSYTITAFTSICVAWIVGLGGPALAGIFAIFPWVFLGIIHTATEKK